MRISDWSSDVCSSDLPARSVHRYGQHQRLHSGFLGGAAAGAAQVRCARLSAISRKPRQPPGAEYSGLQLYRARRSEEHTSELQSLMRISYAVFCLKKKNIKSTKKNHTHNKKRH